MCSKGIPTEPLLKLHINILVLQRISEKSQRCYPNEEWQGWKEGYKTAICLSNIYHAFLKFADTDYAVCLHDLHLTNCFVNRIIKNLDTENLNYTFNCHRRTTFVTINASCNGLHIFCETFIKLLYAESRFNTRRDKNTITVISKSI